MFRAERDHYSDSNETMTDDNNTLIKQTVAEFTCWIKLLLK